jgi:hypothetical protein
MQCLAKPPELLALYDEAPPMFVSIRELFDVPDRHVLDISDVERTRAEDDEMATTAALTLHYVQSLRILAKPGHRVRIASFVNTGACLHSLLSSLALECPTVADRYRMWQARDHIGVAAGAVAAADVAEGGRYTHMQ